LTALLVKVSDKIQPAAKFIWWAFLVGSIWLCVGCISIRTHERGLIGARIDALQKARKIAFYNHSEETVKQINALIKKYETTN